MTTANDMLSIWQTRPQAGALFLRYCRKALSSHLWPLLATHNSTYLLNKATARCKWDKPAVRTHFTCVVKYLGTHYDYSLVQKSPFTTLLYSVPCFLKHSKRLQTSPKGQSCIRSMGKWVLASYSSQRENAKVWCPALAGSSDYLPLLAFHTMPSCLCT